MSAKKKSELTGFTLRDRGRGSRKSSMQTYRICMIPCPTSVYGALQLINSTRGAAPTRLYLLNAHGGRQASRQRSSSLTAGLFSLGYSYCPSCLRHLQGTGCWRSCECTQLGAYGVWCTHTQRKKGERFACGTTWREARSDAPQKNLKRKCSAPLCILDGCRWMHARTCVWT